MGVVIRTESLGDLMPVREVCRFAFSGDGEARLVDALRDGGFVEVSLMALANDVIVGQILFSRLAVVTNGGKIDALSLALMAVVPKYQRLGIGIRLVAAGLETCRERGSKIVLVLGHPEFYSRFGFSADLARPLISPFGGGEA